MRQSCRGRARRAIELTPTRVMEALDVTHIPYRIDGRSVLGGDAPA